MSHAYGAPGYGGISLFAFAIVIYVLLVIVLDGRWWGGW
ncbi:sporulation protein YjcZ [Hydrogenibacillus sp. N12]|uniref:Sporulation protein YjcZ n=1 Tax=Hydrogenibacillus schlegelii TaxID=1484 RepID=A0A2T5G9C3_HYDSH|nr:sporulation protein YjcZ [Hydrogenibacillus schlegelii]PTQ52795.1 MAG: hypothetical protein HSCHL_2681 [Hydrogenibacillus schlegelii]QZA33250.1 sporulation protein YjcZ [Hydrogenibacillus sp. N12]